MWTRVCSRLRISNFVKLPIGFSLKAAYDFEDKVFGVSAPLYLFSDSSGLRGGLRVDWQNVEDKRFGVGVFIGTPFKLFARE